MGEVKKRIPIEEVAAPIRERWAGGIRAWYGTAKQLLKDAKSGSLKAYDRAFASGWNCSASVMGGPLRVSAVGDAVILMHSPMGCISNLTQFMSPIIQPRDEFRIGVFGEHKPNTLARWYCSNITEEEIIFGAERKLRETILAVDRINQPESIFIFISCAAGVMGDDIEGIVKEVQPQVRATIVPVHCEAFQSKLPQWGFDSDCHAILKYLVRKPQQKRKDMVNLIVAIGLWQRDRRYLAQLLEKVGIQCNIIPEQAMTESFRILSEAVGTVCLCTTFGEYLAQGLEQEYGVPYFRDVVPFGLSRTDLWLRKIAQFVGKEREMEKLIAEERAAVVPKIEALRQKWQGLTTFISAGVTRAFHLPYMLIEDFGMELVGLNPFEFYDDNIADLEALLKLTGDKDFVINVSDCQTLELGNCLKKLKPDVYLGHRGSIGYVFKLGIPGMCIALAFPEFHQLRTDIGVGMQMGYAGIISYARNLTKALGNPSLSERLSAYSRTAYKDSWYEEDPSANLIEST